MKTRSLKAGVVLGAVFLTIPARWATAAAESPSVEASAGAAPSVGGSTAPVQNSTPASPLPDPPSVVNAVRLVGQPGPDFFYAIGRDDLAWRYHRAHSIKVASRVLGVAALVGGLLLSPIVPSRTDCSEAVCVAPNPRSLLVMAGGLAAIIVPSFFDEDPLSFTERDALFIDFVSKERARARTSSPDR